MLFSAFWIICMYCKLRNKYGFVTGICISCIIVASHTCTRAYMASLFIIMLLYCRALQDVDNVPPGYFSGLRPKLLNRGLKPRKRYIISALIHALVDAAMQKQKSINNFIIDAFSCANFFI